MVYFWSSLIRTDQNQSDSGQILVRTGRNQSESDQKLGSNSESDQIWAVLSSSDQILWWTVKYWCTGAWLQVLLGNKLCAWQRQTRTAHPLECAFHVWHALCLPPRVKHGEHTHMGVFLVFSPCPHCVFPSSSLLVTAFLGKFFF